MLVRYPRGPAQLFIAQRLFASMNGKNAPLKARHKRKHRVRKPANPTLDMIDPNHAEKASRAADSKRTVPSATIFSTLEESSRTVEKNSGSMTAPFSSFPSHTRIMKPHPTAASATLISRNSNGPTKLSVLDDRLAICFAEECMDKASDRWKFPKYLVLSKDQNDVREFCQKILSPEGVVSSKYVFLDVIWDDTQKEMSVKPSRCLLLATLEMMLVVPYPIYRLENNYLKDVIRHGGIVKFTWGLSGDRSLSPIIFETKVKHFLDIPSFYALLQFQKENHEIFKPWIPESILASDIWNSVSKDDSVNLFSYIAAFASKISTFRTLIRDKHPHLFNFKHEDLQRYQGYYC